MTRVISLEPFIEVASAESVTGSCDLLEAFGQLSCPILDVFEDGSVLARLVCVDILIELSVFQPLARSSDLSETLRESGCASVEAVEYGSVPARLVGRNGPVESAAVEVLARSLYLVETRGELGRAVVEIVQDIAIGSRVLGVDILLKRARLEVFTDLVEIGKDPSLNNRSRVNTSGNTYQDPPLALELQYLITAYPPADLPSVAERMQAQQTLLGRVLQTMYDAAVLEADSLSGSLRETAALTCTINEDKTDRIEEWWRSIASGPVQPSVVYDVGPVFIQSTASEEVSRVEEREINVERKPRD